MMFDVWVSTWVVPILLSALPVIPCQLYVLFGSFVPLRLLVCINELREQHIVPVWTPALNFINSSLLYLWVSSVKPPKIMGFSSKNKKSKTSHSDSQPIKHFSVFTSLALLLFGDHFSNQESYNFQFRHKAITRWASRFALRELNSPIKLLKLDNIYK